MGCYNAKNEYLCTANITPNNETGACVALQEGGYVSFKDEGNRSWSMQFESESEAVRFCAQLAVAMYGASGCPEQSILACDVTMGKRERSVFANDLVKVRYQSWVVQADASRKELPTLGSMIDGNLEDEKPGTVLVPANHLSVTAEMKGFEGMLIGMGEKGSRCIVVPIKAKRGGGPHVHMCFYTHVVKKKDNSLTDSNGAAQASLVTSSPQVVEQHHAGLLAPKDDVASVPVQPPGFSGEQLLVVDRLRDQVETLTRQLRDTRRQLDLFVNDVKRFEQRTKHHSLSDAQVEHSVKSILIDNEEGREMLSQKEILLRQMEEKNLELQKKAEKFSLATNSLAEEKKSAINLLNEDKLDMDRRLAQAQAQLTRLHSEREDVARHLSSVKQLLQATDQNIKTEKHNLQVASAALQANEAKYAGIQANHLEETSRRKVLESKVGTLNEQLRSLRDDIRVKEGQMDEMRHKMESDKVHYMQLIEDEKNKATDDIRELGQELLEELAGHERRYQSERQRVAHDSFERGRFQGRDDGHNEALLEADAITQELSLAIQRRKTELSAMHLRLRSTRERNEADECHMGSEVVALEKAIATVSAQNSEMEVELDSLKYASEKVEYDAFHDVKRAIEKLSGPILPNDLVALMLSLQSNKRLSYDFEEKREEERRAAIDHEYQEVVEWVNGMLNGNFVRLPPTRRLYTFELAEADQAGISVEGSVSTGAGGQSNSNVEEEAERISMGEIDTRYRTMLLDLINLPLP
ncbi:hypothetical protein TRVL_05439 [Trypanosoma vivax]|nr:hypothetical protein TRVL_05439 [Trypanosoma vivax]